MARFYGAWGNADNRYRIVLDISSTQNIALNQSTVSWVYYVESNLSVRYFNAEFTRTLTINNVSVLNTKNVFNMVTGGLREVARGSLIVDHASDGTKTIAVSGTGVTTNQSQSWSFNRTISESITLPTIARASSPTVQYSSRDVGLSQTIYTNRASTSFTHTLQYRYTGGTWANIATGVEVSYSWTIPLSLASNRPNNTSGTVEVRCITYSGGSNIGTKDTSFTFTIPNNETFQPNASITSLNVVDGLGGYYVQGNSKVNVVSNGSGKYGASISQYGITIDGSNYYGSNITSGVIGKSGTITITLRVTDSRGYYSETTSTVTFQDYYSPKINSFSASRNPAQTGTGLLANLDFEIAPIANQNGKVYTVSYREVGGSWVQLYTSNGYYSRTTSHTASGVLDANKSYEVKLYVADYYTSAEIVRTVGTVFKLMHMNKSGKGLAIGKVSESDTFEVALTTKFLNSVSVENSLKVYGIEVLKSNIEIGGENLIPNANDTISYGNNNGYYPTPFDGAIGIDKHGYGKPYVVSFWIKATISPGVAHVYFQNGAGARYGFQIDVNATNEWVWHQATFVPGPPDTAFNIATFAIYDWNQGRGIRIKGLQMQKGTFATHFVKPL